MKVDNLYGNLPLYFELKQGQTGPNIKYLSRRRGHGIYLASDGVYFVVRRVNDDKINLSLDFRTSPEELKID